jgi:hypothetical protein
MFVVRVGTLEKRRGTSRQKRRLTRVKRTPLLARKLRSQHVEVSELHTRLRWSPPPAQAGFRSALLPTRFRLRDGGAVSEAGPRRARRGGFKEGAGAVALRRFTPSFRLPKSLKSVGILWRALLQTGRQMPCPRTNRGLARL